MTTWPTRNTVAQADPDNIHWGEEGCLEGQCVHCDWPLFLDSVTDEEGEMVNLDRTFWQHNDDRYYTPGKASPCPVLQYMWG